jgi:LysR family glycine cleavage system transcriptional activator
LLEDWLQVKLFERKGRRVVPTAAALAYAEAIGPAVDRIRAATRRALQPPQDAALSIATLPSFGMRWLAPRLPDLSAHYPDMLVNLAARSSPFDFADEGFDAAIHFGLPDWPGAEHALLFREDVVAVCSPHGWRRIRWSSPPIWSARRCSASIPARFRSRWFAAAGVPAKGPPAGPFYEHFLMLSHAAAAGLGVALVPRFLIVPELESGALVAPFDLVLTAEEAYYLVWPIDRPVSRMLDQFRAWLLRRRVPDVLAQNPYTMVKRVTVSVFLKPAGGLLLLVIW